MTSYEVNLSVTSFKVNFQFLGGDLSVKFMSCCHVFTIRTFFFYCDQWFIVNVADLLFPCDERFSDKNM